MEISIGFTLDELQTMIALLDGCLGTSDDDNFDAEVKPILKRMQRAEKTMLKVKKTK